MDPPAVHPALQPIRDLDTSSPDFSDQLNNILRGQEYEECVPELSVGDSTWLVNYLDKVRLIVPLSNAPRSSWHRLSILSKILPVPLSGSAYTNSEAYLATRRYSPHHTYSYPTSWSSILTRLPLEPLVTCTRGLSTVQAFASSVCGCIKIINIRSLKYVTVSPLAAVLTKLIGLPPRGCDVEMHEAPEDLASPRRHHRFRPIFVLLESDA